MKHKLIIGIAISILLISSFVLAGDEISNWFDKDKPSETITLDEKQTLIEKEMYVWHSESFWREGNCYYYDLSIGNTTDTTWSNNRRELICTTTQLSDAEIEAYQIADIKWTLAQLGTDAQAEVQLVKTPASKGENIRDETVTDKGVEIIVK